MNMGAKFPHTEMKISPKEKYGHGGCSELLQWSGKYDQIKGILLVSDRFVAVSRGFQNRLEEKEELK